MPPQMGNGATKTMLRAATVPSMDTHVSPLCLLVWGVPDTRPMLTPTQHERSVSSEPGPVEDVLCHPEATYLALNWTMPAGDVDVCLVVVERLVPGGGTHFVFQVNTSGDALLLPNLMPTTSYRLSLTVLGRNSRWSRAVSLVCSTSAEGRHFQRYLFT